MAQEFYFKPGEKLRKRYIIQRALASGGFGEVYEAFDEHLGCKVAIKRVFAQLNNEEYLRREVNILVNHARTLGFMPNVYDHWRGERGTGYFIVMDFIEGNTLDEIQPFPWEHGKVIAFLRIMLRNLHDLHSRGIIHCDIKPVNIKATPPSDLFSHVPYMLLDFGIAKQGNETTIHAYSPGYAAPEQYREHRAARPDLRIDQRTDLYSLAATAYYVLTGKPPLDAKQRFLNAMLGKDDISISAEAVDIAGMHQGLDATLFAMMQVFPEQRPPNALAALKLLEEQLLDDQVQGASDPAAISPPPVEQVVPSEQPPECSTPPASLTGRQADSVPPLLEHSGRVGDAVSAGAEAAHAVIRAEDEVRPSRPVGPAREEVAQVAIREVEFAGVEFQAAVITHCDDVHSLALLPGGQSFATLGTSLQLWTVDADAVTPGRLIDLGGARPRAIAASPDGQMLAVVAGESLQLRRAVDGMLLRTGKAQLAQARGMSFSSGGGELLLIEADAIAVYNVSAVAPVARVALGDARALDHVVLAAGGDRVALHSASRVVLRSLAESIDLCAITLPPGQEVTALALTPDGSYLAVATFDALAVWRVGTGGAELIDRRQISGQAGAHALLFGVDGSLLAALHDRDAHFWHVGETRIEHLAVARGHTAMIQDIALAADGTGAITAARDGTVRLWRLPEA